VKPLHLYEVTMLNGTKYRGEIAYRDDKMLVLKVKEQLPEQKLRLFYSGIISIREMGWQRAYTPPNNQ
jgi:hypothetical protein